MNSVEKIGLIAGSGQFPVLFARAAKKAGRSVVAVGFEGETDPALKDEVDVFYMLKLGQLGRLIECFHRHRVRRAAMAGAINKRRLYSKIKPDWRAVRFALKLKRKSDDFLLRAFADELESEGIKIEPSTEFLPELLAPEGILTRNRPSWRERKDIEFGWRVAKEYGKLDVGQCVVVKDQAVVALEGIDGTDATIRRGGMLCGNGAVVIKVSKPGQDLRFDVPAVGLQTIRVMKEVNARVLVIESGKTLMFDRDLMIEEAERAGICIISMNSEEDVRDESVSAVPVEMSVMRRNRHCPDTEAVRVAVVGVGYLGTFHARKYAAIPEAQLVAVVDIVEERAKRAAEELSTSFYTDHRELLKDLSGKIDAVSVVTPTVEHFSIAKDFLEAGIHVFVEKPFTRTPAEAERLIELADRKGCIIQVGHLERFNPAYKAIYPLVSSPLFIEAHRLSPYTERSTDVDVILDIMIHDLDILLSFVDSPIAEIRASGAPVLTSKPDIATVRLEFENGLVANLTASRVSMKSLRKVRIFQENGYIAADFKDRRAYMISRPAGCGDGVTYTELDVVDGDALEEELRSFISCVRTGSKPLVDGATGKRVLELADMISERIREGLNRFSLCGRGLLHCEKPNFGLSN
ncbi:UDP-2,3-diacylglucosamine diphosphatase LpxI domain-containing protein [Thermodesulforhabdus norvegica]|uniref:Gfo/Idh/MocA family oxidoreductase n=1 Tax=Thermodesulforhabdus norvegica TaxID=39841 RepID=A0A1I4UPI1_9BACT|nr:UDP-2,3-diacylglucosamine diphosphatase LpxI [Thermodesulforhabdus norvegica]SFM90882.1 hypothetical protein SAMN05660836_01914 [Thermodesulforhabdus norvegica]